MSVEIPPEKKPDSASEQSDRPKEHLDNLNQLTNALKSFLKQLAELIETKNWISLRTNLLSFFLWKLRQRISKSLSSLIAITYSILA